MSEDYEFMKWFVKQFKPDPNEEGWYIDKIYKGGRITMEGAKKMYSAIQKLKSEHPELFT